MHIELHWINKNRIFKAASLLFLLIILVTSAIPRVNADVHSEKRSLNIYFFYNNPCESCNEAGKFYEKYYELIGNEANGLDVKIFVYNLIKSAADKKLKLLKEEYKVPDDDLAMPVIFIGDTYITGYDEIESRLKDEFLKARKTILEANQDVKAEADYRENTNKTNKQKASPVLNMKAALIFTLYVFAMMIPLLVIMLVIYKGREIFDDTVVIREKIFAIKVLNAIFFLFFGLILAVFY